MATETARPVQSWLGLPPVQGEQYSSLTKATRPPMMGFAILEDVTPVALTVGSSPSAMLSRVLATVESSSCSSVSTRSEYSSSSKNT